MQCDEHRPTIGREKAMPSHLVPPTTGPLMFRCKLIMAWSLSMLWDSGPALWWFTRTPTPSGQLRGESN